MKSTIGVLLLVLCASEAAAQHPCDAPQQTTAQVRRADQLVAGWCYPAVDDLGNPIPFGVTRFQLMAGTTQIADMGLLQPRTGANSQGLYYYEAGPFTFAQDVTVHVVAVYDGVTSLPSNSVLVDVRGGPKAPSGARIVISNP